MRKLLTTFLLSMEIALAETSYAVDIGPLNSPALALEQAKEAFDKIQQSQRFLPPKIMIFGGIDHNVYLGCLNCSNIVQDSIYNSISPYGSFIGENSIYNSIGKYGSPISDLSVCNEIAMHPPVIVDNRGNFYGSLTLNDLLPTAIKSPQIKDWLTKEVCT